MDKAAHLMQSMPADRAARDMSGAIDFLANQPSVTSKSIGVVGFCMGGLLSFIIALTGRTRSRPWCRSMDFRRELPSRTGPS
jgi:dienelactone hydrolase